MKKIFSFLFLSATLAFSQGKFGINPSKTFPNTKCTMLAASPDGSILASENLNTIQIWNRTDKGYTQGQLLHDFMPAGMFVREIYINYEGNMIAAVGGDFIIYVFKKTGKNFTKIETLSDFEDLAMPLTFTPDGNYLLAGNTSKNILWKINGNEFTKLAELKDMPELRLNHEGNLAYGDGKLYTFKNEKFTLHQNLDPDGEFASYVKQMRFSPDGNYLGMYANPPGGDKLYLYKKEANGKFKRTCTTDFDNRDAEFIEFSADGHYLASYDDHAPSGRKKIMFFEIVADTLAYKMSYGAFTDDMERFQFINDGATAVSGSYRELIVYKVDGVKGNKFYKAVTTPAVAVNDVKKEEPKTDPVKEPAKTTTTGGGTTINIFWINPNPDVMDDKPVVAEKATIEIQVKVISNKKIGKEDIKIIINGKEMGKSKFNEVGLKESASEEMFEYTYVNSVPLEETADHINTIEVMAAGKKGKKPLKVLYSAGKPNLHILAIGTSLDLQFPKKDAQDFADLFKTQAGPEKDKLFGSVTVRKLIGAEASTNAIKESIERYRYDFKTGGIGPRDVMLIFISSHGFIYQDKFRIQGDDYKDIFKETYSVAYEEITSRLKEVQCKKLIFLDACFSGGAKANVADINNAISEMNKQGEGVTTFSSSSNDEYSYEDVKWQNGAFTYSIKDGLLKGNADKDGNGIVTIGELYEHVSGMVPKIVTEVKNKSQHPSMPVTDLLKNTAVYVIQK